MEGLGYSEPNRENPEKSLSSIPAAQLRLPENCAWSESRRA